MVWLVSGENVLLVYICEKLGEFGCVNGVRLMMVVWVGVLMLS